MEERVFLAQKYFIFKLPDMLNNSFHVFEEKRLECLQLVLQMCLDTYTEMNCTAIGMDKLEKSYQGLLESFAFQLKRHPFYKIEGYKSDFDRICWLINQQKKGKKIEYELFMSLMTLQKKLQGKSISCQYVKCLQKGMTYSEIDLLIEAFVSDLLYQGYSLYYLYEWYIENIRDNYLYIAIENKCLDEYISRLEGLDGKKHKYEVVIPYGIKSKSQKEIAELLLKKHFVVKTKEDFNEFKQDWKWLEDTYASKVYEAADYYKAIAMAKKEFSIDKELFSMWQNVADVIHENIQVGYIIQGKLCRVDIRKVDYARLINYFDEARADQLNIFIELKDNMKNEDVDVLERVLHTLHTAKSYNIQNRYLNFWSALEYAIYPFPKHTIIEKAKVLVSESFTLFYIKNKMNIFWHRLIYTIEKKGEEKHLDCKKFIDYCKEDNGFNTLKMVHFLQNKELYEKVLEDMSFHVILEREMKELIMLVTEPKKLKKAISEYHDSIIHDLDCIYRLRNQLIHSAKSMDDSLEHISLRLYRYVNSIVATILYYKKRNPMASIIEILNSMHNTYEVYIEQLSSMEKKENGVSVEDGYRMVRPHYLFLE